MLKKFLLADLLKMKGSSVALAHLLIPILTSGLFLAYYSISIWDENTKVIAFYQAVGAGFPALIGIFTACIMEQEQNAGECQNLLALHRKTATFLSKLFLLLLCSLFSVFLTTVLFGFGFCKILGNRTVSMENCLIAALLLWCSSIPLYVWQIILAFHFGKGISIGMGIVSGLVSALMLTNLGTFIWKYTPVSWTARIPYTYWQGILGESHAILEMKSAILIYGIFTVFSMVYYGMWASHWEGSKISE